MTKEGRPGPLNVAGEERTEATGLFSTGKKKLGGPRGLSKSKVAQGSPAPRPPPTWARIRSPVNTHRPQQLHSKQEQSLRHPGYTSETQKARRVQLSWPRLRRSLIFPQSECVGLEPAGLV